MALGQILNMHILKCRYIAIGILKRSASVTKYIYLYTDDRILFMDIFQREYVIIYNLLPQLYVPYIINITAAVLF